MAAPVPTLHIRQGITYRAVFTWGDAQGTPQPLVGYRAEFTLMARPGASKYLAAVTSDDGSIDMEPDGATGELHLRIGADLTGLLKQDCAFELTLVAVDDPTEIVYVSSGKAQVTPEGG